MKRGAATDPRNRATDAGRESSTITTQVSQVLWLSNHSVFGPLFDCGLYVHNKAIQ
jgi:hypothetical protein